MAPEASHFIWILDDKLPVLSLLPGDDMAELFLLQQLQDEVPQLDLPGAWRRLGFVGPIWEGQTWGGRVRGSPAVLRPCTSQLQEHEEEAGRLT